jgi:cathepsin A (carboxypeptidase C)
LIYAGDADFICNWLGNQAWTEALEWPGQKDFNKAEIKDIKLDNGDKYGKIKSSGNFTFLQVFGAGHMVPSECSPGQNYFRISFSFLALQY